ncbi:hypothetical protein PR048_011840 [Dryococelus australis]|uniref:Uncharacterized protein n=1 Tax=Dryococelus australis TaxID=614101 RepID=A0ABQ9HMT7_9NEOP|nr:hypothetical protein PR048_011840 [Dryococelus australis]
MRTSPALKLHTPPAIDNLSTKYIVIAGDSVGARQTPHRYLPYAQTDERRNTSVGETGDPRENQLASSGTIPSCENPGVARPGIKPGSPWICFFCLSSNLAVKNAEEMHASLACCVVNSGPLGFLQVILSHVSKMHLERGEFSSPRGQARNDGPGTHITRTTSLTHAQFPDLPGPEYFASKRSFASVALLTASSIVDGSGILARNNFHFPHITTLVNVSTVAVHNAAICIRASRMIKVTLAQGDVGPELLSCSCLATPVHPAAILSAMLDVGDLDIDLCPRFILNSSLKLPWPPFTMTEPALGVYIHETLHYPPRGVPPNEQPIGWHGNRHKVLHKTHQEELTSETRGHVELRSP